MRSLLRAALFAALSLAFLACQHKRPEPVPGPQSQAPQHAAAEGPCPYSRLFRF